MSKTRKPSPKKRMKSLSIRVKYKLGGRKSPRSALQLKNDELLELLAKPTRKRDRPKLERLARIRGLAAAPKTEEALTEA